MTNRETASKHLILHTARLMAKESGWASVSMRKIADRIHYKAPIVYQYFDNREDLIAQVLADGLQALREGIDKAWRTKEPESLLPISMEYWKYATKNPELYEAMNLFASLKTTHPALVRETQALCESISKMISEWAKYQAIQNIDPKQATDILWAQLHGFVSLGLTEQIGNKKAVESLIVRAISFFEAGLKQG